MDVNDSTVKVERYCNFKMKEHPIPDLEIIDLDQTEATEERTDAADSADFEASEPTETKEAPARKKFRFNIHIVLLGAALLFVAAVVYRFFTWGEYVDQEEIFKDGPGEYSDTFDQFLPLTDEDGKTIHIDYSDGLSILVFGNSPFSDDKDSPDSLAHLISDMTDAVIYDCSVSNSYMAASGQPMDAYTPYQLVHLATTRLNASAYAGWEEALGEDLPPEAKDVYKTLSTIDLTDIDVAVFMYDATDYLLGHFMYSDENPTDVSYFTGNLEASIELLQSCAPNVRIIVMSPTYAFGVDENGEYESSDIITYGQAFLSTYVNKECYSCILRSVTFVDNLYGTITEDNAREYLTDNVHLNQKGRQLVAERFVEALTRFDPLPQ